MDGRAELLVERDAELASLDRVATRAADGVGGLAVVEGPAGIGKSRLLAAHRAVLRERGVRVLTARGGELEADVPYGLVRQLFEPALARDRDLLRDGAQAAATVFGLGEEGSPAGDPGARLVHALWWLCANVAATGPVVLHVDDAHWADAPSLRFVDHLARRLDGLAVGLVVAWRSEDPGAGDPILARLGADPDAAVVRPGPLGAGGVAALVQEAFGADAEPAFATACHGATRGNPFLLRELLAELRADGVAPTAASAGGVRELGAPAVSRAVLLRLGAVSPAAARLARAIAVLGAAAEPRRAAAVAGLGEGEAAEAVDALVALQILERGSPLAFVHPLVRHSILGDVAPSELAALHAAAARALRDEGAGADVVAGHLAGAAPAGEPWVVEALRAGAARARAQGALDVAARWLERALAEPPSDAALRRELLADLGLAEMSLGRLAEAREHLRESLEDLADPAARARRFPDLAWATLNLEGVPAAVALLEREIAQADARDHETALKLESDLASMGAMSPEVTRMVARRLARFATVRGTTRGERLVLASLAQLAWYRNDPAADVADLARRAWGEGALLGDTSIEDLPAYQVIYALVMADALADAEAAAVQLVGAGHVQGSVIAFGAASGIRAWVRQRRGALADAAADGQTSLDALAELGPLPHSQAMSFVGVRGMVEALVARGELDAAEETLEATGFAGEIFDLVPLNRVLHARGVLRLAQGRAAEGLADLRELGARDERAGVVAPGDPWRVHAAAALRAGGEAEAAAALLDEQLALARAAGLRTAEALALREAALARDGEARIAGLREAVALLEATDGGAAGGRTGGSAAGAPAADAGSSPAELAAALLDLGAALRVAGRRTDATEPLTRALALAQAAGAPPLARRAHEELQTAGARPRRLRFSGAEDLTAAERRVAELAAGGRSNREIAQELFVTPKTVENHLGRIYVKLGIHSRRELAGALAG